MFFTFFDFRTFGKGLGFRVFFGGKSDFFTSEAPKAATEL